jgi:hypothetical protein
MIGSPYCVAIERPRQIVDQQMVGLSFDCQYDRFRLTKIQTRQQRFDASAINSFADFNERWELDVEARQLVVDGRRHTYRPKQVSQQLGVANLQERSNGRRIADDKHNRLLGIGGHFSDRRNVLPEFFRPIMHRNLSLTEFVHK